MCVKKCYPCVIDIFKIILAFHVIADYFLRMKIIMWLVPRAKQNELCVKELKRWRKIQLKILIICDWAWKRASGSSGGIKVTWVSLVSDFLIPVDSVTFHEKRPSYFPVKLIYLHGNRGYAMVEQHFVEDYLLWCLCLPIHKLEREKIKIKSWI